MDKPLGVNRRQRPQHRNHHIQSFLHADLPALIGDVGLKGNAFDVIHDKVGGIVLIEIAGHRRNVGIPDKFGKGPGLLFKPLCPVGEIVLPVIRQDGNGSPVYPACQLPGHVFLHRHLGLQLGIPGQIGDAETALPQHPAHHITVIQ